MNDLSPSEQQTDRGLNAEDETSIIDLLIPLAKRKKLVFGLPVLIAACAALVSLTIPNTYRASAQILPPQQGQSTAAAMLSQLGGIAGQAGSALGIKNPSDLYVGMFTSRTVTDNLVKRFELQKIYEEKSLEKARKTLEGNTSIKAGKNGMIVIEVEDKDSKRAANMANAYVEEMKKLLSTLAVTEASQRRLFFENQLQTSKAKLSDAESALKLALDTRGVVSVDGQSRALVDTVARLRAQISAKDIELNAMQAFVTVNNQEYKRVQQEVTSMRAQLARLENGSPTVDEQGKQAEKQGGLDNIKILRDVKYYEMLYELLAKQYEIARLDEAKDAPLIQVVDKAVEPEYKAGPNRTRIVIIAGLLGLLTAILWALTSEAMKSKRHPEYENKLRELKAYLGFRASI